MDMLTTMEGVARKRQLLKSFLTTTFTCLVGGSQNAANCACYRSSGVAGLWYWGRNLFRVGAKSGGSGLLKLLIDF